MCIFAGNKQQKMADETKKYEKSRKSFIQFGKLLNCESWYLYFKVYFLCSFLIVCSLNIFFSKEMALNPHNLGCSHTFCLICTQFYAGKPCPICKVTSSSDSTKPDSYIENLIEAYLPMAKFLSIDLSKSQSINNVNNINTSKKRLSTRKTLSLCESNNSIAEPSPTIGLKRAGVKRKENLVLDERSNNKKEKSAGSNSSINTTISIKSSASISKLETSKPSEIPLQVRNQSLLQ